MTEQEQLSEEETPEGNFLNACKSAATETLYQKGLNYFMDFIKLGREEYDKLLEREHKKIQMDIIRFINHLKKKNNSYATISGYVSGINKFLSMNDVITLNWKKNQK